MSRVGLRATAGTKTISYGLVQLRVGMMPAIDDQARLKGKYVDPDTLGAVKQQYVNESGAVVKPITAYPYGGTVVKMEKDQLDAVKALNDRVIALHFNVESVPDELVEKTYLVWPTDEPSEQPFKLLAGYLEDTGHVLVGKTHAGGTTKAFALRYSELYGGVVAQLLSYYARVRWEEVQLVRHAVSKMDEPGEQMQAMAADVFDTMPDRIDWDDLRDEYGEALERAVATQLHERDKAAPADLVAFLKEQMQAEEVASA